MTADHLAEALDRLLKASMVSMTDQDLFTGESLSAWEDASEALDAYRSQSPAEGDAFFGNVRKALMLGLKWAPPEHVACIRQAINDLDAAASKAQPKGTTCAMVYTPVWKNGANGLPYQESNFACTACGYVGSHDTHPGCKRAKAPSPAPGAGQVIKIGSYGKAFDLAGDRRAYTYKHQPDNATAWQIGDASSRAEAGGDLIDRGLSLLKVLEAQGFGVFELAEDAATQAPAVTHEPLTDEEKGDRWRELLPHSEDWGSADWFEAGACFAENAYRNVPSAAAAGTNEPKPVLYVRCIDGTYREAHEHER